MSRLYDSPSSAENKRYFTAHLTAFSCLPERIRARYWEPDHNTPLVYVEGNFGGCIGIVLGKRDEPYEDVDDFDREFVLFSIDDKHIGEFIIVYGYNCHVERI
ncbi:hypothetical protein [Beijerinckia mobilis]|uniref:hypothetical protein n=1 Tax=Beijerinckia mobilis TaxID=231434 RepID=UPI0005511EE9|nr:hypothetical protein [Beijerinckia mobilis]